MKTIAEAYTEIAALETALDAESRWLSEKEAWLRNQILTSPDFKTQIERGANLAGIQALKAILPERQKKLRAEIFALHSEIESQKNQ